MDEGQCRQLAAADLDCAAASGLTATYRAAFDEGSAARDQLDRELPDDFVERRAAALSAIAAG